MQEVHEKTCDSKQWVKVFVSLEQAEEDDEVGTTGAVAGMGDEVVGDADGAVVAPAELGAGVIGLAVEGAGVVTLEGAMGAEEAAVQLPSEVQLKGF
jgi:regulator of RNase E activity RraA